MRSEPSEIAELKSPSPLKNFANDSLLASVSLVTPVLSGTLSLQFLLLLVPLVTAPSATKTHTTPPRAGRRKRVVIVKRKAILKTFVLFDSVLRVVLVHAIIPPRSPMLPLKKSRLSLATMSSQRLSWLLVPTTIATSSPRELLGF